MSIKPVLHCFDYAMDFLREQVADIQAANWTAQPPGVANHPAWIVGHLTLTCQELASALGAAAWLPQDWAKRFGTGSTPLADSGAYESKDRALSTLQDARQRLARAVEMLDDARLDEPFPDESHREVFPTLGHAVTQVLVGHTAYHIGQLSVWRRAMGLPGLQRGFE